MRDFPNQPIMITVFLHSFFIAKLITTYGASFTRLGMRLTVSVRNKQPLK